MAFEFEELSRTGSIAGGSLWVYATDDSINDILTSGYFNAAYSSLRVGDIIQASSMGNLIEFRVSSVSDRTVGIQVANFDRATKRKTVRQPSDFDNPIDSSIEYFIDGIVDMGSTSIEVPATGINLTGYNFDVSKLISSEDNYTMFTSPGGGSGNFLGKDYAIEVTGANSRVYNLASATGFDAFEFARINYNDCSSLGILTNYRQGFETGTGRFGGKPELELAGTWLGGFFVASSIARSLVDGAYSLFKAGSGFTMNSRFRTNANVDLPASASLLDFSASNFPNPSTLQLVDMIITRDGSADASDPNITPNIGREELPSAWTDNAGIPNTHEGGRLTVTSEVVTTIVTQGVFVALDGVWTGSILEHFDEPSNGQLRHLGNNPREYEVTAQFSIDGPQNAEVEIRLRKFDSSTSTTSTVQSQTRQVNNLIGARDVAFFNDSAVTELDQNDYLFYEVANNSGTQDLTCEVDSFFLAKAR